MTNPAPPYTPVTLPTTFTPLYRQVQTRLAQDTDPAAGLLAALGTGGINSIFPNFSSQPDKDPGICPRPFVVVYPYGRRKTDRAGREARILVEVHDDPDLGSQRWPGILERLYYWLLMKEWRPTNDTIKYVSGLYFDEESPDLIDTRYNTTVVQVKLCCAVMDRTSGHGHQG